MIFRSTSYDFTFNVGIPDRTWSVYVSKDGGEYILAEGIVTPITNSGYVFSATETDMDANIISVLVIENNDPTYDTTEAIRYEATIVTEDPLTFNGAAYLNNLESILTAIYNRIGGEVWTYTMYSDSTLQHPLEGCLVRMTLDSAGTVVIGEKTTDSLGKTQWLVNRGASYYMWRSKLGYAFNNPDIEIIDSVGNLSIFSFASQENEVVKQFIPVSATPMLKKIQWPYRVFSDPTMTKPLEGCIIRLTRDIYGRDIIGEQVTDINGSTIWDLDPGVCYVWREKDKYKFVNPDKQIVKAQ